MPTPNPVAPAAVTEKLLALGRQIRAYRKALRVSATAAAQAAGMSRVTLHRIENGEASVTMGAYLNAMAALGLDFGLLAPPAQTGQPQAPDSQDAIPVRIRLADYPQLKQLAWQVHGTDELTPAEALGIYERNWRHLDPQAMQPHERHLIDALRRALGESSAHV
jgi:transcriptional regulator with XRE-family HTH domain